MKFGTIVHLYKIYKFMKKNLQKWLPFGCDVIKFKKNVQEFDKKGPFFKTRFLTNYIYSAHNEAPKLTKIKKIEKSVITS